MKMQAEISEKPEKQTQNRNQQKGTAVKVRRQNSVYLVLFAIRSLGTLHVLMKRKFSGIDFR